MAQSSLSAALRSALILFVVNASSNVWAQNADDHQQERDQQEAPSQLPHITIEGSPISGQFSRTLLQPEESHYTAADAARLLKRAPGANINNNGPLSSQVQYRGMFGPRVNVLVDGHHRAQGGPNWMDPPLHYLPSGLVDHIEITRGIASVSSGGETIGGTVKAFSKTSQFNEQDQWASHGSVVASFRSVDDAFNSAAIVTASNKNHRLHVLASVQDGDDIRAGRGTIAATEHER
jgi:iron complex outermembrane receptor protein